MERCEICEQFPTRCVCDYNKGASLKKILLTSIMLPILVLSCGRRPGHVTTVNAPSSPKLECKVYDLSGLGTTSMPVFSTLPNLGSIQVESLNNPTSNNVTAFNSFLGTGHESLVETFGMVCEGKLKINTAGAHTFYLNSDDGSKLFLNGIQLINNDGNHAAIKKSAAVTLLTGEVNLRVEYYNAFGNKALVLSYKEPSSSFESLIKF